MEKNQGRFGTFEGVFTPTVLTIIGVMMYLRLGWVVGNAGFGGALLIIMLAKVVTLTTGISIASMATVESNDTDRQRTEEILRELIDLARMPFKTEVQVFLGDFKEIVTTAPKADVNIFGASRDLNAAQMHTIADTINTTCLFVKDSGEESVLA
ncbi:MAG: hypothetical protein JW938_01870 [Candidatus Omnitrophica bacterium]|nr:hypothetical protein [Candidatus Omnitrophota bacterium]